MKEIDQTGISRAMIQQDASFVIGLLILLQQQKNRNDIPFLLSSIDFFSLIIHEASQYHIRNTPEVKDKLQGEFSDTIKQARQRMKLFDDKALGIDGIGDFFINILTPKHQTELSKNHKIPLPKWMWSDIGIYQELDSGVVVGSTHVASFNSGVTNPSDFFSGEVSHNLGQELGSFLKLFAKNVTLVRLRSEVSIQPKDIRYKQIYSRQNYGSKRTTINAGLSAIDMRLNFLATLSTKLVQWPTLFKWKYLSIYHSVSSLKKFSESEHYAEITTSSKVAIERVLNSPIGIFMLSNDAVPLRNTLTHYGLDSRLDITKITENPKNLFGLVEASTPDWSYQELHDFIDQQLQENLLDMFSIWSKAKD